MDERKKILIYLVFATISMILGVIVFLIISYYVLYSLDQKININNLSSLLQYNTKYYLIQLIPFLSCILGLVLAHFYLNEKKMADLMVKQNQNTKSTIINFAKRISKGNLTNSLELPKSEFELKESLEEMRQQLLYLNKKEIERNTVSSTIVEMNELLRPINELQQLADKVISFIINKTEDAVQGAFYYISDDKNDQSLVLTSLYAYDRKKHIENKIKFSDGIIGQAVLEKDIIHLTEIPENYISITSALIGHKKPRSIIVLPLMNNDEVKGVIELASINYFSEFQIEILKGLGKIIALTINTVKSNEKTISLLKESEKMSAELVEQKRKLMQNAEEMIAKEEELKKTNLTLEERIQEVRNNNRKTQIILENSLEIIFIYNKEGIALYVSPSILPVLGYFADEILGKKCVENIHPLDTTRFENFISDIISFPEKKHILQYQYFTKNGDILWMEAIGKISSADLINGIVINARDISEQKLAEKEQRIRAKMQALSENSLDIIIRLDIFSRCTYINPAIKNLTGMDIADFINKPLNNTGLDESVVSFLKNMSDEIALKKEKKIDELVFPTSDGDKILEVSAIPEFTENGDVESVLFVCHDITTARNREELIKKNNKSIKDSINYAYYIQSSLLPKEEDIQAIIPKSFMYYLPKDIVSGDYPFFYQHGDLVYIGAMDCTGHGVPGALMSIIGNFLQNNIIQNNHEKNAGELLSRLHESVVSTLRQEDEDSMINDGMDAAFCSIDLKNNILNFAGAHRPLYYVNNGSFREIRGDKYPVGSTQYSNRKDFTNHEIRISANDAFYLTTDGYADQYGGPNGKSKFMSGRLSLLIKENTNLSIFQMKNLLKETHEDWKGNIEQLDDILIIGLKF